MGSLRRSCAKVREPSELRFGVVRGVCRRIGSDAACSQITFIFMTAAVQDVCQSAVKELELERKLEAVVDEWKQRTFTLDTFKGRGELLLNVDATMKITSQLEDSLMVLASLSSSRYDVTDGSARRAASRASRCIQSWRPSAINKRQLSVCC